MENKRGGRLTSVGTFRHCFCFSSLLHPLFQTCKFMILQPEWYSFLFKMQKKKSLSALMTNCFPHEPFQSKYLLVLPPLKMACGFGELQWVRKLWKQTHEAYLRAVSLCLCLKLSGGEDLVSAWSMWRPSVGHRGLQASFALLLLWFRECVLSVSPSFMFSHSVCQKVCKCL